MHSTDATGYGAWIYGRAIVVRALVAEEGRFALRLAAPPWHKPPARPTARNWPSHLLLSVSHALMSRRSSDRLANAVVTSHALLMFNGRKAVQPVLPSNLERHEPLCARPSAASVGERPSEFRS